MTLLIDVIKKIKIQYIEAAEKLEKIKDDDTLTSDEKFDKMAAILNSLEVK